MAWSLTSRRTSSTHPVIASHAHHQQHFLTYSHTNCKKTKSNFCYKPVTKIHNTQTACLKTLSQKGWKEYNDQEQTNKSGSGLHSLVSEGALFTYCSSLPPPSLCPERFEWTQASCRPKSIKITENLGSPSIPDYWKQPRGPCKKAMFNFRQRLPCLCASCRLPRTVKI